MITRCTTCNTDVTSSGCEASSGICSASTPLAHRHMAHGDDVVDQVGRSWRSASAGNRVPGCRTRGRRRTGPRRTGSGGQARIRGSFDLCCNSLAVCGGASPRVSAARPTAVSAGTAPPASRGTQRWDHPGLHGQWKWRSATLDKLSMRWPDSRMVQPKPPTLPAQKQPRKRNVSTPTAPLSPVIDPIGETTGNLRAREAAFKNRRRAPAR